jgi:hypothetical protein
MVPFILPYRYPGTICQQGGSKPEVTTRASSSLLPVNVEDT